MRKIVEFFARNHLFGDLLTILIIGLGIVCSIMIRKDAFPNVTFDIITVTTIFPGASPEEVEKLITNPLEQEIKEVDGIKILRSFSLEGRSFISAQLDPDQTNDDEGKKDIQDAADRIKAQLPDGAEDPLVTSVEAKYTPIIEVAVAGQMSEMELREEAKKIEDDLEFVPGVARVVPDGIRDMEIHVQASPKKLQQYRLSLDDLASALKRQNISIPGGILEPKTKDKYQMYVRTVGDFIEVEDVKKTVVRANDLGQAITIGDVAEVKYALKKADTLTMTDGMPGMRLTILKKVSADVIKTVDSLKDYLDNNKSKYDERIQIAYVNDMSYYVRRRLGILSNNLLVGLFLVLLVLSLILPTRVAMLVSLGIPIGFLGTMIVFYANGLSINLISMLGLIIVVGMLVDDAIVVTDNCVRYIEEGMHPEDAAVKGTMEIMPAITAAICTTIIAFLPMLFMSGIFGKFVRQVPLAVIIPLIISLLEAFVILPSHIGKYLNIQSTLQKRRSGTNQGFFARIGQGWDNVVVPKYVNFIRWAVGRRYLVGASAFGLFVVSIILAVTGMKFVLFPPEGVEIFIVRTKAPVGTPVERTAALLKPVEEELLKLPKNELKNFVTRVGIHQQEANDPMTRRGSQLGQIMVYLTPEPSRDRTADEIMEFVKKNVGEIPGFKEVVFTRVSPGPPVGRAIDLGVRAPQYAEIMPAVERVKEYLKTVKGVKDVSDTYDLGKEEMRVIVNPVEAAAAGLDVATIGTSVRAAFEGIVPTSVRTLDEEIDVRVSLPEDDKTQLGTLTSIQIPNRMGNLIPLSQVATFEKTQGISTYEHEAFERQVRVIADVDPEVLSASEANNMLREKLPDLAKDFPHVTMAFGGEDRDTKESMESLVRAFALAIVGIFFLLILTFKSVMQPLLILLTLPFGVISVIIAFFIHGMPLSFLGMMGIIALGGVIVNNSIVFIDFVNNNRIKGMDRFESIIEAAKLRIRPIFLTTVTTICGVLPTAYGIGGLDKFVVPIAMALGWGLMVGSILTIFIFPSSVAILDDVIEFFSSKIKTGPASP